MSFLLDTNVVSEICRGRDPNVRSWVRSVDDTELHLSVLTLGEIRAGIERLRRRDAPQAEVLAHWLAELRERFADRVLPVDAAVADEWGRVNAGAGRNTVDSLIAASARIHGLGVATRNTKDFDGCGISVINPWEPE